MSTVLVGEPVIEPREDATVVRTSVQLPDGSTRDLWYRLPRPFRVSRQQCIDAFFVVSRLVAMKQGAKLVMPGPVAGKLLDNAELFQDIYMEWFPKWANPMPMEFERAPEIPPTNKRRAAASTFTAGVDSYYTVLENHDYLQGLVFVHGLDIGLKHVEYRAMVAKQLADAAAALNLPLWQVETNVRRLTDPYAKWGNKAHGSILASIGILLSDAIDTFYIPSSLPRGSAMGDGWGSHVITDRLHSTDYLSVVHHGVDAQRPEKTARIAMSDASLRHLRVCYSSRTDYNCGHCSKCRRTMLDLELAGVTDFDGLFAHGVPVPQALREFTVDGMISRIFALATINRAKAEGRNDIARGLRRAVQHYDAALLRNQVQKSLPTLRKDPKFLEMTTPVLPRAQGDDGASQSVPDAERRTETTGYLRRISRRMPRPVRRRIRRVMGSVRARGRSTRRLS